MSTTIRIGASARLIALLALTLVVLLGLAACGDTTPTVTPVPVVTDTVVPPAAADTPVSPATDTVAPAIGTPAPPATDAPAAAMPAPTATPEPPMPVMTDTLPPPVSDVGQPTATAAPAPSGSGGGTEVQATLREWAIDLSQTEVPAGTVRFVVSNTGRMMHNLTVTQDGTTATTVGATNTFPPSAGPQTLEVTLQPGTYVLICSLPGHAQRGQRITLTVK